MLVSSQCFRVISGTVKSFIREVQAEDRNLIPYFSYFKFHVFKSQNMLLFAHHNVLKGEACIYAV